jgi:hypothetical protein
MLTKCANPECTNPFRYLRGGRLFRLSVKIPTVSAGDKPIRRLERFWLCNSCSTFLTLVPDDNGGVRVAPLSESHNHNGSCIQILDMRS